MPFHWCFKIQRKACLCQEALPQRLIAVVARELKGGW